MIDHAGASSPIDTNVVPSVTLTLAEKVKADKRKSSDGSYKKKKKQKNDKQTSNKLTTSFQKKNQNNAYLNAEQKSPAYDFVSGYLYEK